MVGQCDRDSSRASADVEDFEWLRWIEFSEGGFDEVFGLRPRDEDRVRDAEGEAVEFLLASDVLDRLVGEATEDKDVVSDSLRGGECAVRISVERGT